MSTLRILFKNRITKHDWLIWLIGLFVIGRLTSMTGDVFIGLLPGNDDLMRLQQVRDLLAGQSWFDVNQARMVSPEGGAMHWSRIVDLPLAAMILLLTPVVGAPFAESLTLAFWPIVLAALSLIFIVQIGRRLGFTPFAQACVLGCLLSVSGLGSFAPGRIDHHGLLILLSLVGFWALSSPLRTRQSALILGVAVILLATIALEGLVYAVILVGLLGLSWILSGHQESERMVLAGLVLVGLSPVAYALDAPGVSRATQFCDAYGVPYLAALVIGGGFFVALGAFGSVCVNKVTRLILVLGAGAATLAAFSVIPPGCLGDPYAALPDSVREMWLQNVMEARSVGQVFASDISMAISQFGFLCAGVVAAGILVATADRSHKLARFLLLIALLAMTAISAWQLRGTSFATIFAAIAAGGLTGQLIAEWWSGRGATRAALAFAGVLMLPPGNWGVLGARVADAPQDVSKPETRNTCRNPSFFRALPKDKVMTIFAPVDLGTSIWAHSHHTAYAGPYHRNPQGIASIANVFTLPPGEARTVLAEMNADHLLFCAGLSETNHYLKIADGTLVTQLEAGDVPEWLSVVSGTSGEIGEPVLYKLKDHGSGD